VGVLVVTLAPRLLEESHAGLAHRHFDLPGAAAITSGLMLLVYAMTHAVQHGWGSTETVVLLAVSGALIAGFVFIELRSKAPLLPMRMFRLRTLTGSNIAGLLMGVAIFSQFFLLTLYMQQVLHYSAIQTGVAYLALTLTIIVFANVAQAVALKIGLRIPLVGGLLLTAVGLVLYARLPVDGHYFWDLFPAFLVTGLGMAFAFIPMTIGALAGVRDADAGVASGLINTTQQIGGAIGTAAVTTIAATATASFLTAHPGALATGGPALTHGFATAFYVLAAVAAAGAVISAFLVESHPATVAATVPAEAALEAA
jgi:Major Facilitator Superfamily